MILDPLVSESVSDPLGTPGHLAKAKNKATNYLGMVYTPSIYCDKLGEDDWDLFSLDFQIWAEGLNMDAASLALETGKSTGGRVNLALLISHQF